MAWILLAGVSLGNCSDGDLKPRGELQDFTTLRSQMVESQIGAGGFVMSGAFRRDQGGTASLRASGIPFGRLWRSSVAHRPGADHLSALYRGLDDGPAGAERDGKSPGGGTGVGISSGSSWPSWPKKCTRWEIVTSLAETARGRLLDLGYRNIRVKAGDGYQGWPEAAPFEGIMVTAAPNHVPGKLCCGS